ncbi:hypothetical protein MMC17_006786 [Xylographa soralifera]|nr:hypothetical protein [Xylographa soralifera]
MAATTEHNTTPSLTVSIDPVSGSTINPPFVPSGNTQLPSLQTEAQLVAGAPLQLSRDRTGCHTQRQSNAMQPCITGLEMNNGTDSMRGDDDPRDSLLRFYQNCG